MNSGVNVLDRLLEVTVLLQKDLDHAFRGTGLTTARTHLLWELRRLGPSTQQALAVALGVSPRNITGLVDALESTGFVVRGPHPTDRRATLVSLTDVGAHTMAGMERDRQELGEQLVAGFGEHDIDQLERGLGLVTERLRALMQASAAPVEVRP